ncbi:MAG: serine/threonine-protein kinase [Myxococcales bacterium]
MTEVPKENVLQGERAVGRYRLEARIGRGGMCEVYRATALAGPWAGRIVAIKRLLAEMSTNPQAIDRFLTEADVSILLRHRHIVEVLEAGEMSGGYFIAMEHVDGRDLAAVMERCRAKGIFLPVDFAVYVVSALLEALEYAHEACSPGGDPLGIVHCDVTPGNVFVSRSGEIKLGDFGIARVRSIEPHTDGIWGKPYYLPPEAFEGASPSPATDLWAAAVILYELLTNRRPFAGQSLDEVGRAVREAAPTPPHELRREVPEELSDAVRSALSRNPDRRYATAGWFRAAIARFMDERIGTQMAIASLVRGLFGSGANIPK